MKTIKTGPIEEKARPVGLQEAWPVLYRALCAVGFLLARRTPSGRYEVFWPRILPLLAMTGVITWFLITSPITFTNLAYDHLMTMLAYYSTTCTTLYTFALGIYKRREICQLLEALEGTLKPCRTWMSVAMIFFLLAYSGIWFYLNYFIVDWESVSFVYLVAMTVIAPMLPLLADLYVCALIHALGQAFTEAAERMGRGSQSLWAHRRDDVGLQDPKGIFSVQNKQSSTNYHVFEDVDMLIQECGRLYHIVDIYNEIFSSWTFIRCVALAAKLLENTFYVALLFGKWPKFLSAILYWSNEVGSFFVLSRQADCLKEAHNRLEDALMSRHLHPATPSEDRPRLLGLLMHLKSRPAQANIGRVGVLGSHILYTFLNIAVTYVVIVFQYRPQ